MQLWGRYVTTLLIGWAALSAAGWWYAGAKDIPAWAALPVVAAFLVEFSFYLVPGFESVRARLESLSLPRLALLMTISGALPYIIYTAGAGLFDWRALLCIMGIAGAVSFWYAVLPAGRPTDLAFAAMLAAIMLGNVFDPLYPTPAPQIKDLDIFGQLMLIRLAALAMLSMRRVKGVGFGFVPRRREWWIGLRQYAVFVVVGFPLGAALGVIRWPSGIQTGKVLLTFFGIFWVVALAEEFFFRGLLQQWLRDWTGNPRAALMITAVIFGLVHLPFREFPNWRVAVVAAIAGWFYGRAYQQAGSIRAPMVTHALVVTTWRAVLS
jgi:membrane protease YdiL (CAAX protease family)